MNEPEDVYDWHNDVATVYRQVLSELDQTEPVLRREAFEIATGRLVEMHGRGEIKIPAEEVIEKALEDVDRRDGQQCDAVLNKIISGQDALELGDDDPFLDTVVTLGAGQRKQWRYVIAADLREMDQLRYRNVSSVQKAYDTWRDLYDTTYGRLAEFGGTMEDAIRAGVFRS